MNYLRLIVKNPFRNKTRTSLAIVGIAIGIATIVALGLITSALQASTQSTLNAGAADITVMTAGSNILATGGSINESLVSNIQNISGVQDTAGILKAGANVPGTQTGIQNNMGFIVGGIDSNKLGLVGANNVNGTIYSDGSTNEIILMEDTATDLNKTVGDNLTLFGKNFKIVGTFKGNFIQSSDAYMPLNTLQNLTGNNKKITNIAIKVNANANATNISQSIQNTHPELSTITATQQANSANSIFSTINAATTAISLLAILIGGIGVINTMVMSVYERTREIGVLKAIGWKNGRILGMILGESIVLTVVAGLVGTVIGIVFVEGGLMLLGNTLQPVFTLDLFLKAFGIAFLVGIIGGIYPAYRASRLPPTEALRYE